MEYYNGILCISGKEFIRSEQNPDGLISVGGYKNLINRKRIVVARRGGGEGSPALIVYDSLPSKYRKEIEDRSKEDLETLTQKKKLIDLIEPDQDAVEFFYNHTIEYNDNVKGLPENKQKEYVRNAELLNAIKKAYNEHVQSRAKQGKRPLASFWEKTTAAIKSFPDTYEHSIPKSTRRLQEKIQDYTTYGYESLISDKFANTNTVKITEEAGEWIVAQWMSHIDRVNIEQLHARYNFTAESMGWKKLKSSNAIRQYLYRPEVKRIWLAARYGELEAKNEFSRQNRTILAKQRDTLWYSDGTKLNYYYQDEFGNVKTCNVYEVMDVYSEAFLGYHISATEDYEAQYAAYKMAIQFSGYKPYEIKYDNQGGHKKLENSDFLKNLSDHAIRTAPYNGRSKTIESAFGRFQQQYLHQDWFFTGQNITTKKKESRVNMEFILANTKQLPTLDQIKETYKIRRDEWNNAEHHKTGLRRIDMYRSSVNEKTKKVGLLEMIDIFGVTTRIPSTYTSAGIEIQVKKKQYAFEVLTKEGEPDRDFNRRNIGRRLYVRYQPDDMSMVALYEKDASGEFRFIEFAQPYLTVHRAMQDQTPYDLHIIRQTEHRNKEERIEEEKNRNAILEKHGLHPNQHGLNVPPLKGITTKKKKKDIGELQKEISNITELEQQTRIEQRAARKAEKDRIKEEHERLSEQEEFTRNRLNLLKQKMEQYN
ncbi:kinase [Parabacteroides sp. OttesenSCG-928-K15]|nr:kinase [Parabacteroides sp. OttesenSCG-928-K15]